MKKLLLLLLMFSITSVFSQEKIYGDFYLFQSKKEVKKVFKNNKEKYQNITFAGQDFWMINKLMISSFNYQNDKLTSLKLFAKKIGASHELQTKNVRALDKFFLERGFKELFRQTHWDTPVFFDNAQYGVVYHNEDSNTVINLTMRTEAQMNNMVTVGSVGDFTNNHTMIEIYPYSLFERQMKNVSSKKQQDNSDF